MWQVPGRHTGGGLARDETIFLEKFQFILPAPPLK